MHLNVYLLVVVLHTFVSNSKKMIKKIPSFAFSSFKSIQRLNTSVRTEQNSKAIQTLTKAKTVNLYRFEKQKMTARHMNPHTF